MLFSKNNITTWKNKTTLAFSVVGLFYFLSSCTAEQAGASRTVKCDRSSSDMCRGGTSKTENTDDDAAKSYEKTTASFSPTTDVHWVYKEETVYLGMEVSAPQSFSAGLVSLSFSLKKLEGSNGYSLNINGNQDLLKPIEITFPGVILADKTISQRQAMRYVFQNAAGQSWLVKDENLISTLEEGIVGVKIHEWGTIIVTDPNLVASSDPDTGLDNPSQDGDPYATKNPVVSLSSLPSAIYTNSTLSVSVGGTDVKEYRYQILSGNLSCSLANNLSSWKPVATKISDSLSSDGQKTLCVKGRASNGTEEASIKVHHWLQDSNAPAAPGAAIRFKVNPANFNEALIQWASAGTDSGQGMDKQQVLIYADNTTCSGTANATIDVSASATSLTWNRNQAGLKKTLRFAVRAIDLSGKSSDSACSGSIKLENGLIQLPGTKDNMQMAAAQIIVNVDFNNDGINDLVFQNSSYRFNRGYIAVLLSGNDFQSEKFYIYEGELSGDQVGGYWGSNLYVDDFNLDGYQDLMIPNSFATGNGADSGAIYIIFGGATMAPSGSICTTGRCYRGNTGDKIGFTPKFVDFTGDGVLDFFGGYGAASGGGYQRGVVALIPTGVLLPPSGTVGIGGVGYIYNGETNSGYLGFRTFAEDVTGDGIKDLVAIESYGYSAVVVIPGGVSFPASGSSVVGTTGIYRYEGQSTNSVNTNTEKINFVDWNNDGIKDIVISNWSYGGFPNYYGAIWIIRGQSTLPASGYINAVATWGYTGNSNDQIGSSTYGAVVADVNCDTKLDLIFGSSSYSSGAGYVGVLLNTGGAAQASGNIWTAGGRRFSGTYANEGIGYSFGVSDLNGDGCGDISGYKYDAAPGGLTGAGHSVYIYGNATYPSSGSARTAGRVYEGSAAGDGIYPSSSFVDMNNDGKAEILYQQYSKNRNGKTGNGFLGIIPGTLPASGTIATRGYEIYGDNDGDAFGRGTYVSSLYSYVIDAEDLNGDSNKDLILASPAALGGKGSIFVVPGGTLSGGAISTVGYRYDGDQVGDALGSNLMLFDIDNDGDKDIISFSPGADPSSRTDAGSIYIIYNTGSLVASAPISTAGTRIDGDNAGDALGTSLTLSYKINADARFDIISYAPTASPSSLAGAGSLYMLETPTSFAGGAHNFSSLGGMRFDGAVAGAGFGSKFVVADLNGDSQSDFVVSTTTTASTQSVYAIYGNQANPSSMSVTELLSNSDGTGLGALIIAQDMNGDAKAELMITHTSVDFESMIDNGAIYAIVNDYFTP